MSKIIEITKCDDCPHLIFDPGEFEHKELWGRFACTYDRGSYVLVEWEYEIPSWCPLGDAK